MTEASDNGYSDNGGSDDGGDSAEIGRRGALKKAAVGLGVAGIVWTAPRIDGLSLRPNYAAAQSAPTDPGDPTGPQPFAMDLGSIDADIHDFDFTVNQPLTGGSVTVNWNGSADFGDIDSDFSLSADGGLSCTFDTVTFNGGGDAADFDFGPTDGSISGDFSFNNVNLSVAGTCV